MVVNNYFKVCGGQYLLYIDNASPVVTALTH